MEIIELDNWDEKPYIQSLGIREKTIFVNPNSGEKFFFKKSIPRYPWEFWSEIISSHVGQILNFDVVKYDLGIHKNELGCLCKLVTNNNSELIHGLQLILSEKPNFDIKKGSDHSFQLIERVINLNPRTKEKKDYFLKKIIEMTIFDSIIGNKDRHQENWAILFNIKINIEPDNFTLYPKFFKLALDYIKVKIKYKIAKDQFGFDKTHGKNIIVSHEFSPLYDNGSSLGRELLDDKIESYIGNKMLLDKYTTNGIYHIKWNEDKLNHFDLLNKLNDKYFVLISSKLAEIQEKYDLLLVQSFVSRVDEGLAKFKIESNLSEVRKKFICELIDYRILKLLNQIK